LPAFIVVSQDGSFHCTVTDGLLPLFASFSQSSDTFLDLL